MKLRAAFKDDSLVNASPFFEWERFTKKNRNLLGYNDFYWLYNVRWLRRFDFYIDKHFSDDLYLHTFGRNKIKFGFYLYSQWNKFFLTKDQYNLQTLNINRFFLYKRYYVERYITMIKDIDFIFHEYSISNKKVQRKIFSYFDFFIPKVEDKLGFTFKKNIVRRLNQIDLFWFNYATPQLLYKRDWIFTRAISQNRESKEFYFQLKKSLFKAYSIYERNRISIPYDFFEFRFFEPEFYDELLYENVNIKKSSYKNYFLHKIALSRWNSELVYTTPGKNFYEMSAHIGYREWIEKLEYYYHYIRRLNESYFGKNLDFGMFSFIEPVHSIITHIDAETVKNTIDLSVSDDAIGIKYSELYQYEDLGRVATEQYLFELLDSAFFKSKDDPTVNIVALTDDRTLTHKHNTIWIILIAILPALSVSIVFLELLYVRHFTLPQQVFHDILTFFLSCFFSEYNSEILLSHKLLTIEQNQQFYWLSPWTWIRTYIYDLYFIDRYSFWTGKHAKFLQAKEEYSWIFTIIDHDDFRYDNISFLCWNFYVLAWHKCKDSVILFVLVDIFFYFICILISLFVINFSFFSLNIYRYLSSRPHLVIDKEFDIIAYQKMEEEAKNKRELKKKNNLIFFEFEAFDKLKNKIGDYKKDPKRRRF